MDYEVIESDKELWEGYKDWCDQRNEEEYEAWCNQQADAYEYQRMVECYHGVSL